MIKICSTATTQMFAVDKTPGGHEHINIILFTQTPLNLFFQTRSWFSSCLFVRQSPPECLEDFFLPRFGSNVPLLLERKHRRSPRPLLSLSLSFMAVNETSTTTNDALTLICNKSCARSMIVWTNKLQKMLLIIFREMDDDKSKSKAHGIWVELKNMLPTHSQTLPSWWYFMVTIYKVLFHKNFKSPFT